MIKENYLWAKDYPTPTQLAERCRIVAEALEKGWTVHEKHRDVTVGAWSRTKDLLSAAGANWDICIEQEVKPVVKYCIYSEIKGLVVDTFDRFVDAKEDPRSCDYKIIKMQQVPFDE